METTHGTKPFTATRAFTDREDAKALFLRAFDGSQPRNRQRVLHWHGVGGEGKSRLSNELLAWADALGESANGGAQVARARIDFQEDGLRRPDAALLAIRLQLAKGFGAVFPCFDTAFARHLALTHPGVKIRDKHPELFQGENELLNQLADGAAVWVPGVNVLVRNLERLSHRTREWFQRRGKHSLAGLDSLSADQVLERLPSFLGVDLCDHLAAHPEARALIVVDTHEALWRGQNLKDHLLGARADTGPVRRQPPGDPEPLPGPPEPAGADDGAQ